MTAGHPHDCEGEQELLRLYVLFGLLFRVAMVDGGRVQTVPLKLSYQWFFEEISRWAEREHHRLRRKLQEQGCRCLTATRQDGFYVVQYRHRGYVKEAVYSIEVLRAQCQELARSWMAMQRTVLPGGPKTASAGEGIHRADSRKESGR